MLGAVIVAEAAGSPGARVRRERYSRHKGRCTMNLVTDVGRALSPRGGCSRHLDVRKGVLFTLDTSGKFELLVAVAEQAHVCYHITSSP